MKTRLFVIAVLLTAITLGCLPKPHPAEEVKGRPIRLKSRTFIPKPGLEGKFEKYLSNIVDSKLRIHHLVQFEVIPDLKSRKVLLDSLEVRLLDPIPEQAFFISIPANKEAAEKLLHWRNVVRWIGMVEPDDKIAPHLKSTMLPEHALRPDNSIELIVQFFGDVDVKRQEEILGRTGAVTLTRIEPLNGWRLVLKTVSISGLASQDEVKWIEATPLPMEEDNDGVRDVNAVNSNSVSPPNIYDLSGAGVVIGQWESRTAGPGHLDFGGRLVVADLPVPARDRSRLHDESVTVNNQFDVGEIVYVDIDDNGTISLGDVRVTAAGASLPAGTVVAAGDSDLGTTIVFFNTTEKFLDIVNTGDDWRVYTNGEPMYNDIDNDWVVSVNDIRLMPNGVYIAGSTVATGDTDMGQPMRAVMTPLNTHSTHVAGIVIGDGSQSTNQGGGANQWRGVAPGARIQAYADNPMYGTSVPIANDDYFGATGSGVTISTNSWGTSHCHKVVPPNLGYESGSQYYDAVISGRQSDGTPSGLPLQTLILGSSGNSGRPERYVDNNNNSQYDNGEAIYYDRWDDAVVSVSDIRRLAVGSYAAGSMVAGGDADLGQALTNFGMTEMHDEGESTSGTYSSGEAIYIDNDGSLMVSSGDTRITGAAAYAAGSVVAVGDTDDGTFLRQFRLWGNVRIPNSAKNTIEVANIASDSKRLSASSSRGPTDDGRIKPDLAGPGSEAGGDGGIISTFPVSSYSVLTGTSMSTPAVAGCAALLTEWHKLACQTSGPSPMVLKALLIHSAEDILSIPNVGNGFLGPDFAFGYGRADARKAVDLLPHFIQGTLTATGNTDYQITIGTVQPLKVTLVWDDPPWTANALPSPVTGLLQNDLDLLLIAPDGNQYTCWIANSKNPFAPSAKASFAGGAVIPPSARDRQNPVEQVIVDNAIAGIWTIRVTGSTLNLPPQNYVIASEMIPPQSSPCAATPSADIWMRDNANDNGVPPSSGTLYLSPDVWNRLSDDDLTGHQNPEFGQPNYLYANLRNLSTSNQAISSEVDFWLGAASTGLAWPANFSFIGRISVPYMNSEEVRQIGPLQWDPPPPSPSDHYCLYMRAASPQDPITFSESYNESNNAKNSNNIVWRNLNIVDLTFSKSVTFLVRNIEPKMAEVNITIQVPPEFLKVGKASVRLSQGLIRNWPKESRDTKGLGHLNIPPYLYERMQKEDRLGVFEEEWIPPVFEIADTLVMIQGLQMGPSQAEPVVLTFGSNQMNKAEYVVNVIQYVKGREVGGIQYIVRTGFTKDDSIEVIH